MTERIPTRIFRCPYCGYDCERRYVLKNHLQNVHGLRKRDSETVAMNSEYHLNPRYYKVADLEVEDEEI